jgi:hypothetical protein
MGILLIKWFLPAYTRRLKEGEWVSQQHPVVPTKKIRYAQAGQKGLQLRRGRGRGAVPFPLSQALMTIAWEIMVFIVNIRYKSFLWFSAVFVRRSVWLWGSHIHTSPPLSLPLFLTLLDRKLGAKSPPATGPWHENHTHNPLMVSPLSANEMVQGAKRVQWVSDLAWFKYICYTSAAAGRG